MVGFATIQDAGRFGYRADGVPQCGAMDMRSLARANTLVGNAVDCAAIEWAMAGGMLRFNSRALVAVAGAQVDLARNGSPVPINATLELEQGDDLTVERFASGAYAYVAVQGGIDVPSLLGSCSTYLPAGFGGVEGRRLRAGDRLLIGRRSSARGRAADHALVAATDDAARAIRVIEGPNNAAFTEEFRDKFWASEFTVSRSSNRTGYRLERAPVADFKFGSSLSAPACLGAIQVPSGAAAIVLMRDGPTVGGYPMIGVVTSVDISVLAQRTPGSAVTFERIPLTEAQRLLR